MPHDTKTSETQFELATGMKLNGILDEGNGTIYSLRGHPDKVVKIVFSRAEYAKKMMKLLKNLKKMKSPAVVRIHKYGTFKVDGENCYYYVMDKLRPLGRGKWSTGDNILSYLAGDYVPRDESSRIKSFVKKARKLEQRYHYGDVHGGNIMISKRGALKFVDLESFTY